MLGESARPGSFPDDASRTSPVDPDSPPQDPAARAQWERARRTWQLSVTVSADALSSAQHAAVFRTLRVKRFEREACLAGLPGPLRSGAFVDLAPLREALEAAKVPCRLAERLPSPAPATADDRLDGADSPDRV